MDKELLFGKFEVIECLKKDEGAAVYLAFHIYLGKKIILKSLNTRVVNDPVKTERFKREAKILAKLDHPNIIKVLDFGLYEDFFFISFEYFEGNNLRVFLNAEKAGSDTKKDIAVKMLRGLNYAHNNNIIHRDLKPENILINENLDVKISDFGLALILNDKNLTEQASIVGTPSYMSPEQIQGERLSAKTDLFSLGIIFYELFIGSNPFTGGNVNEIINKIINYDEAEVLVKVKGLPEEVSKVISMMLKKSAEERARSAGELLNILGESSAGETGEGISARRQSKSGIKIIAALLLIISAALIYYFAILQRSENSGGYEKLTDSISVYSQDSLISAVKSEEKAADNNRSSVVEPDEEKEIKPLSSDKPQILDSPGKKNSTPDDDSFLTTGKIGFQQFKNRPDTEAVSTGKLHVECLPWAYVYVNSEKLETTPLSKDIELATGVHQLKLFHPDFPEYTKRIVILKDQITTVKVDLNTIIGYLDCKVYPWGEIYINGKLMGQTPMRRPIKLRPGTYHLVVKNPSLGLKESTINITEGETLTLEFSF